MKNPSEQLLRKLLENFNSGQYDEAEKLALSITQEFPKHQFSWKVLGLLFGLTNRFNDSVLSCEKAVELNPKDAEAYNNLSVSLNELGRFNDAIVNSMKSISLKPDYAEAYYNMGIAFQELGKLNEAEVNFKRAIDLKKGFSKAISSLGMVLLRKGKHKEGIGMLRIGDGSIFFDTNNGVTIQ
mgnify:CR=1 FL=1